MTYTVLARKYRPQTFADLVGQEHVARTLGNAIDANRVAHAFLFTGVRGVGKTTSARLLAKSLNCEKGPIAIPCNECDPCKEITAGVDMDVQEMDGASNNSVDDVRRLQESIPYRPARDRFKIVIVDEVHMLSTGAFNAFLKTLEEPPPHVKFIFATTESHKVPITIRSRCQRYDFRLIPQQIIADRVRTILTSEGITTDDAAVNIVAREAAGSMRDALTLLDQIVAFAGDSLHGEEVARTLGIADRQALVEATKATLMGDGRGVLKAVESIASQGVDTLHFARQLLSYLRELTVLRVTDGDAGTLSELVMEERDEALALAREIEPLELQRAFSALSHLVEDVGRSSAPRTVLEMGLLRIATRPPLKQVGELLARLDALEKTMGGGGGGGSAPRRDGRDGRDGRGGRGGDPGPDPRSRRASSAPQTQTYPPPREARQESRQDARRDPRQEPRTAPPARTQTAPATDTASGPASATDAASASGTASGTETETASETATATVPPTTIDVDPGNLLPVWHRIITQIRDNRPALGAILEHGVPLAIDRKELVVSFPEGSFYGKQVESKESREGIAEGAAQVIGGKPAVVVRYTKEAERRGLTVAEAEAKERTDRREERRREALSHPRVQEALQVFPEGAGDVKVQVDIDS